MKIVNFESQDEGRNPEMAFGSLFLRFSFCIEKEVSGSIVLR